tara:strand:- start:224 stop:559 length:336 start_codon:yes stop_codon:yes gene_type:complete
VNLCAICKRSSRGFGFIPKLAGLIAEPEWFCSKKHLDLWKDGASSMDFSPLEKNLVSQAGKAMGEYLESIQKYNLVELTKEEWQQACECLVHEYCTGRIKKLDDLNDEIPF